MLNDVRAFGRGFASCIFPLSGRSTNNVTHVLASRGLVGKRCSLWTKSLPVWIQRFSWGEV